MYLRYVQSLFFILLFSFCAPVTTHYIVAERHLAEHDLIAADAVIKKEEKQYGANNRLLYLLDRGLSLSLAGHLEESNKLLDRATVLSDQLYTESISLHAASLLTNDNALPYTGEDFERVLIHGVSALNYAQLGLLDDALVECRRMDTQLNKINNQYRGKKTRYQSDPFAHYLAAILYEARGEVNDAFVAYRKADALYRDWAEMYRTPIPSMIGADLLWATNALGLHEEYEAYQKRFQTVEGIPKRVDPSEGEMIIVSMHGKSPYKESSFFDIIINANILTSILATTVWQSHMGSGEAPISLLGQLVRVAVPKYVAQKSAVQRLQTTLSNATASFSGISVPMQDITAIAIGNMEDRLNRMRIKAIARATIKAMAVRKTSKKAEKELGEIGGFFIGKIAEAVAATTEVADTRSWRTLPDQIHLTRMAVPPGDYQISTRFIGQNGGTLDSYTQQPVSIMAGEKRFILFRTIY